MNAALNGMSRIQRNAAISLCLKTVQTIQYYTHWVWVAYSDSIQYCIFVGRNVNRMGFVFKLDLLKIGWQSDPNLNSKSSLIFHWRQSWNLDWMRIGIKFGYWCIGTLEVSWTLMGCEMDFQMALISLSRFHAKCIAQYVVGSWLGRAFDINILILIWTCIWVGWDVNLIRSELCSLRH